MRSGVFSIFFLVPVLALPTLDIPLWTPPGPGDVRSPCPLLNTLANHNIISHSGKDITIPMLKDGFKKYVNVGPDVAAFAGGAALTLSPIVNSTSFNLNDLDKHNAIEHDGSLS